MMLRKTALIVTLVSMFALAFAAFTPATAMAKGRGPSNTPCNTSIVDVALAVNAESGEFSTLIAALSATKLVPTFDCRPGMNKTFTVFAPTDEAFAKLGLNKDNIATAFDKRTLRDILLYHVVRGKALYAADVVAVDEIRMWRSGTVGVDVREVGVFLLSGNEPSQIVAVDIATDNGVIHIIDTVLLPQQ